MIFQSLRNYEIKKGRESMKARFHREEGTLFYKVAEGDAQKLDLLWKSGISRPRIQQQTILIPKGIKNQVYQINDFEFLLKIITNGTETFWYCGMNNNLFIYKIYPRLFGAFKRMSAPGFYSALKPPIIKEAEELFKQPAHRTDLLWYIKLAQDWEEARRYALFASKKCPVPRLVYNHKILNAGHILNGMMITLTVATQTYHHRNVYWGLNNYLLVEGAIQSPHNTTIILSGINLVEASPGIYC